MKPLTLVILSAGLLLAGAPEGKELYTAKCQNCHGANGEGKAAIGKMFNVTMPVLASKEVQDKSDADLKKVILTGKGKMKPVAGIAEKQADDVVAYVRTLK
ncbi:MAG TPA: cytochrome c [Candidatus Solibacter sp.]|jgi:mono/diheme cytochrome c family protein|nr:cytochrome c [Candidatus Solibacter sp.]